MKTFFFLFTIFNLLIVFAQPEVIYSIDNKGKVRRFDYKFGDEFNGNSLNRDKWLTSYPWGQNYAGTCYQEWMTDGDNITIENGILKLDIRNESIFAKGIGYESDTFKLQDGKDNLRQWEFTSGMIFSKEQFRKGIFEVRFKLPNGQGLWPAFWLYGGKPNEEFDIFEAKGEKVDKIHYDMHCPNGDCKGFGNWLPVSENLDKGFNTMSGEWNENSAYWFFNGKSIATWAGILNEPANIIANLGLANDFGCAFGPGQNAQTVFPATFEIDYIRLYQELYIPTYIRFKKEGGTKYTFEHGSANAIKKGSEQQKMIRRLKKKSENETLGHIRVYKDEVLNRIIYQMDDRSNLNKIEISILDQAMNEVYQVEAKGKNFVVVELKDIQKGTYRMKIKTQANELYEVLDIVK